jgi:hypothetical protein
LPGSVGARIPFDLHSFNRAHVIETLVTHLHHLEYFLDPLVPTFFFLVCHFYYRKKDNSEALIN